MSPEEWLASKKEKESIPSPEEWLASKKPKDEVLSPEEWLAMKVESGEDPEVKENYKKESKGFSPSIVVGIPGAGMVIPTTPQRTQKSVDEEQKKRVDKAEEEQGTAESITRIVAGLGTEIAIAESSKVAGTALGAKLGALGGPSAPVTIPTGAAIGYVSGAVFGGVSGSIAAQRIEGKNEINWGRVAVDTVLNLVPGTKVTRGPKALRNVTAAMARNPVITNAAIGAIAGPASEAAQRYHETGEIPDYADLVAAGMLSSTLGAGLGYSQQKMLPILRRFVGKSSDEINDLVNKGDSGAIAYVNALTADVDPQEFLTTERVLEYVGTLSNTAKSRVAPSKLIGTRATQAMRDAGNMVIAGKEVGSALGSRVNAKIRESADPAAMQELAMEYLIGKSQTLPKELSSLQDDLSLARKYIKEYQDGLLEMHYNGQRELPELLLKKIEASRNEGDYLTRSYAFFDDKGYFPSKKDTEDLINDLTTRPTIKVDKREFVTRTNPDGSKTQIENPDFGKEYEAPPMSVAEAETYIANLNLKKADNPDELHN